jgi:hypothetical protein
MALTVGVAFENARTHIIANNSLRVFYFKILKTTKSGYWSGRPALLLAPVSIRTVHATFTAHGSSPYKVYK